MSKQTWNNTSGLPTPSSGNTHVYTESTLKELATMADDGVARIVRTITKTNTTGQSIATSDTYITNSNIAMPAAGPHAGMTVRWVFGISRSGAGTAQPVYTVRFGTGAAVGDSGKLTFTGVAQTNAADVGWHELVVVFRSVGSGTSAVIQGLMWMAHNNTTTGLANIAQAQIFSPAASGGFDSTVAGSFIGVSVNPGASSTWVFDTVVVTANNV